MLSLTLRNARRPMPTLTMRTAIIAVALSFAVVPAIAGSQGQRATELRRELSPAEQAAHALSRLTFGARPGDMDLVMAQGVDRWIEQQLHPTAIRDTTVTAALSTFRSWTLNARSLATLAAERADGNSGMMRAESMEMSDSSRARRGRPVSFTSAANEFVAGEIIHAQLSERQLEEVMTDFWLNHFSVYSGKMPSVEAIVVWVRDVIRPHAMGSFREMLGAVAHSPAMLFYLDNSVSRTDSLHRSLPEFREGRTPSARSTAMKRQGINENYARELLELHTLGVNGGYSQQDVIEVARAFTGWSIAVMTDGARSVGGTFEFVEAMHDAERKTVLGQALAAGRGVEDGEQVLDIIARHPATAQFIATKLARRFVSDSPPPALVERAAATFIRTNGNITEVVRTIVTSPEFFSRAAFRSKVKSPLELLVSMRRALNAPADTSIASARAIAGLGQPMFGYQTPEGWPDVSGTWMHSGAMFGRLKLGADVAAGRLKYFPTADWIGWTLYGSAPLERQVDGVITLLLGGTADAATRNLMLATATPSEAAPGGTRELSRLRELVGIALNAPEFQRR
jgi:uncharacterized protein (DUF1800 family)